jgi:hypothetical protein
MIIYVNGDSHSAAAEAVNPHCFAEDDPFFWGLGRRPHPENERVSYGCEIANALYAILWCDAEAASSNQRIMRTTRSWINEQTPQALKDTFMIIQWSTWEREEWLDEGVYYQVNASGIDHVPEHLQSRYQQFIADVDWQQCTEQAHQAIWEFHQELQQLNIRHVMFNGNSDFSKITTQQNWGNHYLSPYDPKQTYDSVLKNNGFFTVKPDSWHFGADAHCFWANHVLQYVRTHNII